MKKIAFFSLIASGLFAANCTICHNGIYKVKLDKFTPEQITEMMMDFKSGKKAGMTMPSKAKRMSDEEIKKLAEKFGKKI
jgi:cytochrome c553